MKICVIVFETFHYEKIGDSTNEQWTSTTMSIEIICNHSKSNSLSVGNMLLAWMLFCIYFQCYLFVGSYFSHSSSLSSKCFIYNNWSIGIFYILIFHRTVLFLYQSVQKKKKKVEENVAILCQIGIDSIQFVKRILFVEDQFTGELSSRILFLLLAKTRFRN